jgi:hypothetical protein
MFIGEKRLSFGASHSPALGALGEGELSRTKNGLDRPFLVRGAEQSDVLEETPMGLPIQNSAPKPRHRAVDQGDAVGACSSQLLRTAA